MIGPAAALAGDAIWVSFLVAAVISAFSGLSYAELATAMPSANAEHNFLRQALPKLPAVAFAVGLFIAVQEVAQRSTEARSSVNGGTLDAPHAARAAGAYRLAWRRQAAGPREAVVV